MKRLSYSASGSPVGQIGAPGAADQQRVAGEHAVLGDQAHRVARVAGRVHRRAAAACPTTSISPSSSRMSTNGAGLARCITTGTASRRASSRVPEKWSAWVCVSIEVADAQALARGERDVAVDLAQLRIDQRRRRRCRRSRRGRTGSRRSRSARRSCWHSLRSGRAGILLSVPGRRPAQGPNPMTSPWPSESPLIRPASTRPR